MPRIIKTFSCSEIEDEFLNKNNISPSKLIQGKIQEMMEWKRSQTSPEVLKEFQRKLKVWQDIADKQRNFIDKKKLMEEYIKFTDDKNVC